MRVTSAIVLGAQFCIHSFVCRVSHAKFYVYKQRYSCAKSLNKMCTTYAQVTQKESWWLA